LQWILLSDMIQNTLMQITAGVQNCNFIPATTRLVETHFKQL